MEVIVDKIRRKYEQLSISRLEKVIRQGVAFNEYSVAAEVLKEKMSNIDSSEDTNENTTKPAIMTERTKEKMHNYETPGGYFSFNKMITVSLIKIIYTVVTIAITISGILMINKGMGANGDDLNIISGISTIIAGNLVWRLFCEFWILFFSLHETTVSILNELKQNN